MSRKLTNQASGIDLSVPAFREVEAPLGGSTVEYEIAVLTNHLHFKTSLHEENDVVQFSVFKAYREAEDLYNKIHLKHPSVALPPFPKSSLTENDFQKKQQALDNFMKLISKDPDICKSAYFLQFFGVALPASNKQNHANGSQCLNKSNISKNQNEIQNKDTGGEVSATNAPSASNSIFERKLNTIEKDDEMNTVNKLFPKVKINNKLKKQVIEKEEEKLEDDDDELFTQSKPCKVTEASSSTIPTPVLSPTEKHDKNILNSPVEQGVDIFEEMKKPKEDKSTAKTKKTHVGLFDDVDNQKSQSLFDLPASSPEKDLLFSSDLASKHLHGTVSLDSEGITKEEEPLFLVTSNKDSSENMDTLLGSILRKKELEKETDISSLEISDTLDDLLQLDPLPNTKNENVIPSDVKVDFSDNLREEKMKDIEDNKAPVIPEKPPRPVPKPRTKISPPVSSKPQNPPSVQSKQSQKPALPPKPSKPKKPSAKPTAQPPETKKSENSPLPATDRLNILKYIEEEQKLSSGEPSLFD